MVGRSVCPLAAGVELLAVGRSAASREFLLCSSASLAWLLEEDKGKNEGKIEENGDRGRLGGSR